MAGGTAEQIPGGYTERRTDRAWRAGGPVRKCDCERKIHPRLFGSLHLEPNLQKAKGNPVLLFDSGDFTMGTPYDNVVGLTGLDSALDFFQRMNYTAITLGNHEFDWTPNGIGQMILI